MVFSKRIVIFAVKKTRNPVGSLLHFHSLQVTHTLLSVKFLLNRSNSAKRIIIKSNFFSGC